MINVVAKNFAKAEMIETIIEQYKELVTLTRMEKGCIAYELHQDVKNPQILTMIEQWESMTDLEAHLNSEHLKRIVPSIKQHMERETELNIYEKRL